MKSSTISPKNNVFSSNPYSLFPVTDFLALVSIPEKMKTSDGVNKTKIPDRYTNDFCLSM